MLIVLVEHGFGSRVRAFTDSKDRVKNVTCRTAPRTGSRRWILSSAWASVAIQMGVETSRNSQHAGKRADLSKPPCGMDATRSPPRRFLAFPR